MRTPPSSTRDFVKAFLVSSRSVCACVGCEVENALVPSVRHPQVLNASIVAHPCDSYALKQCTYVEAMVNVQVNVVRVMKGLRRSWLLVGNDHIDSTTLEFGILEVPSLAAGHRAGTSCNAASNAAGDGDAVNWTYLLLSFRKSSRTPLSPPERFYLLFLYAGAELLSFRNKQVKGIQLKLTFATRGTCILLLSRNISKIHFPRHVFLDWSYSVGFSLILCVTYSHHTVDERTNRAAGSSLSKCASRITSILCVSV